MRRARFVTTSTSCSLALAFLLLGTTGCGVLVGIEDLYPEAGPNGAGGSAGGDAASDRSMGGSAGSSGSSGTGGAAGSTDVRVEAGLPDTVVNPDTRADVTVDMNAPDRVVDAPVNETVVPETGGPDVPADDARDVNVADVGKDADGGVVVPDAGPPDTPKIDVVVDSPTTIVVQGKLLDFWRHPVPNVLVNIGASSVTTDANGAFTVSGVSAPYDVMFTINTIRSNTNAKYGWIYKGITRPDPTLQVGAGLPDRGASAFIINISNVDFANLPATEAVTTSYGGPDGEMSFEASDTGTNQLSTLWYGPTTTAMTGHALHWSRQSSSSLDLPTGYLGYASSTVNFSDNAAASTTFDLATSNIGTANVSGTVTPSPSGGSRANHVFLTFPDNASIELAYDTSQATTFSYLLPTIQGASVTVAAAQGDWSAPPFAVVHRDGLTPGQTNVTMTIPDSPTLLEPAAGQTMVTTNTLFRWSGAATAGAPKVFLWGVSFNLEYKGFFIVTTEKQAKIPSLPDGPVLPPNSNFTWWVETNGSFQTMDEATGQNGLLDPYHSGDLSGARHGDGQYTTSEWIGFTSAP